MLKYKKHCSLTGYCYYAVALVKIENHRFVHSQGCEIASYIWKCISEEAIKWNKNYALS